MAPYKAFGTDDIHCQFIKQGGQALLHAITKLLIAAWDAGVFPQQWKLGIISPIPKTPKPADPTKYRPIALLSVWEDL